MTAQPPPDPPLDLNAPDGYEYRWREDTDTVRFATDEEKATRTCRRPGCEHPPAIALIRGFGEKKLPWLYCADHMYGRRIRDGRIEWPRLERLDEGAA